MSDELFSMPASDPPLEVRCRLARIAFDEAAAEFEAADTDEDGRLDQEVNRTRIALGKLEAELLRRTTQQ
jgi:5-hydroxyisourate hydrolase-like protein (transthyretin family)